MKRLLFSKRLFLSDERDSAGDVYVLIYCMTKFGEKDNFEVYSKGGEKKKKKSTLSTWLR